MWTVWTAAMLGHTFDHIAVDTVPDARRDPYRHPTRSRKGLTHFTMRGLAWTCFCCW